MAKELTLKSTEVSPKAFGKALNGKRNNEGQQAQEGIGLPPLHLYRRGKATERTVKSRSRPTKRRNRSLTRTQPKPTIAADGSGDVFPRELSEGCVQSLSMAWVRTVGFGPRPRGATVGDWTFGNAPGGLSQTRKHLLPVCRAPVLGSKSARRIIGTSQDLR